MDIPTFEELQNMTDEEVTELNRKLALRAFGRFAGFMLIKWVIIFGATHAAKKWVEQNINNQKE